jgi:nitrogen regulatory protein P-II 1
MKRIEAVITPYALDTFKEATPKLGIAEFDVVHVYCSSRATIERRRFYRGCEYTVDLIPRLRLEFVLFDDDVQTTLHELLELVHPESIAVFTLDQTISPAKGHAEDPPPFRRKRIGSDDTPARQTIGLVSRKGGKDSDIRFRGFAPERG